MGRMRQGSLPALVVAAALTACAGPSAPPADLILHNARAYTLAWDGKDDEGRQVIANKYKVCIEVVREHGTYQLIQREIELLQKPIALDLEGNAEVAKAKLVFGKVARSVAK